MSFRINKIRKLSLAFLAALPLVAIAEIDSQAPDTASSGDSIRLGDVLMRSLRPWPKDESDSRDTLATAKAFKVNRILWIYENSPEFNEAVHAAGIGIGTTMADNARESWINRLSRQEAIDFVQHYTNRNLDGEQILPEHMKKFGNNPFVTHFQPDQTNPQWLEYYVDYVAGLYGKRIEAIHRDDPGSCSMAPRSGGTFTDSAVEYFRHYLRSNYTVEELKLLDVADVTTFNVREHFKKLGAPVDNTLWQWKGSPLMPIYLRAMMEADKNFFLKLRKEIENRTGRKIPWSLNGSGPIKPYEAAFDFRIGEFQSHFNQPQTLQILSEYARKGNKLQAWVSMIDKDYASKPEFVPDSRRHIATAYALGTIPLVPWCMFMHGAPRYYGTVEDFGDLYHFVSNYRKFFDEHELISTSGVDMISRLYSWLPNKELSFGKENQGNKVWLNDPNVFAFTRKKPGADDAVIHLVDWNSKPKPFTIAFSPQQIVSSEATTLEFLRPGKEPLIISSYLGGTIELPEISPWGLLIVKPTEKPHGTIPAPRIVTPSRSVVPEGQSIFLASSTIPKASIMARFLPDSDSPTPEFQRIDDAFSIPTKGTLEAFISHDGKQSEVLKVHFDTYKNASTSESQIPKGLTAKDMSSQFTATSGEMKLNGSFVADKLVLIGQEVKTGISTRGDTTLTANLDPSWQYFTVNAGIDDAEDRRPCGRFQVLFDNQLAYETPIINPTKQVITDEDRRVFPIILRIPTGAKTIQLRAINGGFFKDQNIFVWSDPKAY